ncbi:MAG: type II toxin-antitoxin system RelE/ParE family toxin [Peptococcaceae bacterium]|nr:type II toxin-antitoxin system RelE/ParE family toxin [Peptococcaceae bacterium]MBQ3509309.1 type II toxin-antitoxin system RelE/ParE family toxin [Peptococcaceae bacterium]
MAYNILFYKDRKGNEPVLDYLKELNDRNDKDSRIKMNKILDYIGTLSQYGTRAGEPYVKHLDGDIWELRPLKDRILFVGWKDSSFVLLHTFVKKTQKTPVREILKARKEFADFVKRSERHEKENKQSSGA